MRILLEEIRCRREKLTLTQEEAAIRAGWSSAGAPVQERRQAQRRWNDIERGRRDDLMVSTLADVATALRCRLDDLVDLDAGAPAAPKVKGVVKRAGPARPALPTSDSAVSPGRRGPSASRRGPART